MKKKVRKAVIPAAGFGTRFLPATKAQPKEMLPIVDKPAIQYIVEEAKASGIEEILIITGRNKRSIEDHFDTNVELELLLEKQGKEELLALVREISDIEIHYIRQKEVRGLGDAIYCARSFIDDEPFAVLLGDDLVYNPDYPCLKQLLDSYSQRGGIFVGAQFVPENKVSSYGIVAGEPCGDKLWKVRELVEKPTKEEAPSNLAVLGRYILSPSIFETLRVAKPGTGGEIQLTDAISNCGDPIYAFCYDGIRYDTGDKLGYLKATVEYALRDEVLRDDFKAYLQHIVKNEEM